MMSTDMLIAATALIAIMMVAAALLHAWRGWLELKRRELELAPRRPDPDRAVPDIAARIELADLRERVRKLEAIASGVDL